MDRCNEVITITDEWVLEGHEPMESIIRCELEQGHPGCHKYQCLSWRNFQNGTLVLSAKRPDLLPHAGQKIRRKDISFEGEEVG
ncbi:hypothetical protein LCGC14_1672910 [marine sediment metagenome]|uniref:Uncharacterized protein n=1 Tax=marine sediment metagenome TaxID=412755 RepID=A0A0F9HRH7_9ZZZZ